MKQSIEYYGFVALRRLAQMLSPAGVRKVGETLGEITFSLLRIRRRITMDNLRKAFPGADDAGLRDIARGAYRNYGSAIVEMLWGMGAPETALRSRVWIENNQLIRDVLSRGKGLILLSAHFGSWELLLTSVPLLLGFPLVAIVQRQRNSRIDALVDAGRRRFGNTTVPMGPSVREVLKSLREGRAVLILGDQSSSRESVFVDFFGRPAATHRGAAAFSLKTGAPIILLLLIRQGDGTFLARAEEIDRSGLAGYDEESIHELTRRHTAILERRIREHPDHWLWMHKRWKHTGYFESLQPPVAHARVPEGV
jgi:KDO2-lipid IV(A) lauroyltransferase